MSRCAETGKWFEYRKTSNPKTLSVPSKLFAARVKERLKIKSIYPNIYMGFCFESTATIFW